MYDVIVVGGGPAGSSAAITARQHGLRTLLLDRETFPRDKACGDALGVNCYSTLQSLGINTFDSDHFFPVEGVLIRGRSGIKLNLELDAASKGKVFIVPRVAFDDLVFKQAAHVGAEVVLGQATGVIAEAGQIKGIRAWVDKRNVEYRSRVVIAADGATSAIAREVQPDLPPDQFRAVALRGYVKTKTALGGTLEFQMLNSGAPGYAWFFPISSHVANIGIGMRLDCYKRSGHIRDHLQAFLDERQIRSRIDGSSVEDIKTWPIPFFYERLQRVHNGLILVGDAGRFVDPLAGSGIYQALATGRFAAQVAATAIRAGDVSLESLSIFDGLWKAALLSRFRRSGLLQALFYRVPALIDILLVTAPRIPGGVPFLLGKI